jgi:uncharacterized membrane protein
MKEEVSMLKSPWRKRFAIIKSRLYLYPAPEPLPHVRKFWIAFGLVAAMALAFALFYCIYLFRMQDAFMSPAEDVGIMDQAVWSIMHGQLFHQTICNIVNDTNCYGANGFSRFAIHFEPILFPISISYLIWPGPKMLILLQTLVVASGAFPAFWLARLRLRSESAGVVIAALYLLYPELQQAEAGYFHAVVLTSALLLFMLYFLYTRRTLWVFVFAILAMACKEEIPVVIFMLGLWSIVFQQRWRSGLGLAALAVGWVGLDLLIFHLFSPLGHPLLASRYSYLGSGVFEILRNVVLHPAALIKQHVLEHAHLYYIRLLFSPVNYLSLLAPWVLILALPSVALNLLSTDPNMYQGTAQYNAEIIPILIFATIESFVLIVFALQWITERVREHSAQPQMALAGAPLSSGPLPDTHEPRPFSTLRGGNPRWLQPVALALLLAFSLVSVLRHDQTYGVMPISQNFIWPQVTAHNTLAQHFINMIPSDASVSAQSSLVPHLSQRANIYMFPYEDSSADYIFLDVTSDRYPYAPADYQAVVKNLLLQGNYGIFASGDGYLLLKHGLPAPGLAPQSPAVSGVNAVINFPQAFCSFVQLSPQAGTTPVQVNFLPAQNSGAVSLVGFQVKRPGAFLQLISYWKVSSTGLPPLQPSISLLDSGGTSVFASSDFSGAAWCPNSTWQPGTIVQMSTSLLYIGDVPRGPVHLALALLPYGAASGTINGNGQALPLQIVQAPAMVTAVPGKNLLQLQTFTL